MFISLQPQRTVEYTRISFAVVGIILGILYDSVRVVFRSLFPICVLLTGVQGTKIKHKVYYCIYRPSYIKCHAFSIPDSPTISDLIMSRRDWMWLNWQLDLHASHWELSWAGSEVAGESTSNTDANKRTENILMFDYTLTLMLSPGNTDAFSRRKLSNVHSSPPAYIRILRMRHINSTAFI